MVERVEATAGGRIDLNGGERKRFKDFEPDAVMLGSPSLEEWLPEGHLTGKRFQAQGDVLCPVDREAEGVGPGNQ